MKRTLVSLLSLLAIALVTLASCSEPNNNPDDSTAKSISVKVVDAMNAKTISPTGAVDVSHYKPGFYFNNYETSMLKSLSTASFSGQSRSFAR